MSHETDPASAVGTSRPSIWQNRDFRRFFLGQFVTNVGDSLYAVAILWLVHDLSGSTFLTGVASSLLLLPYLLQIIAGPIVDRYAIKPILVGTQLVQGIAILALPVAAYTGTLTVWVLLLTVPVLSAMTLLAAPVQSTLLPRIVREDQLAASNSALASVTQGLDMIFEALGGLFIAVFGATALFVIDSVTFAIAAILFFGVRVPKANEGDGGYNDSPFAEYVGDLRTGIATLRGTVFVDMLLIAAVSNFAVGMTLAILPAYGDALGGAAVYGLLLGAIGTGRMIGAAVAPWLEHVPFGWLSVSIFLTATVLWVGAVYVPPLVLTVGLFGLAWIAGGIDGVLIETLNQRVFPATILGRISAIKGTASLATLPLGALVGGIVGAFLGPTMTMMLAGLGFGFAGLYYTIHPQLRRLPAVQNIDQGTFDVSFDQPPAATTANEET